VGYPVMETRFARGIGDPLSAEDIDDPESVYELPHKSNGGECNRLITNKKQNI